MQLETIKIDPRIARIHYHDYMKRVRIHKEERKRKLDERGKLAGQELGRVRIEKTKLEKEDDELLKAYRALCRGQQLIHVPTVILNAGYVADTYLPKLAICRADAEFCHVRFTFRNVVRFSTGVYSNKDVFEFSGKGNWLRGGWRNNNNLPLGGKALVPSVPPQLRPDRLDKYFILWEAEWEASAPVDPVLLSRVNTTMFAVVAQWDLTPLERQVLEGRFSS